MLDQVLFTQKDSGLEISNIVLMGIGEPLDNMETVLRFSYEMRRPVVSKYRRQHANSFSTPSPRLTGMILDRVSSSGA